MGAADRRDPRHVVRLLGGLLVPGLICIVLFFRATHIPLLWRVALLVPVGLLAVVCVGGLVRFTERRLFAGAPSVWPELIVWCAVPALLLLVGLPAMLVFPFVLGWLWCLVQLLRGRPGRAHVVLFGGSLIVIVFGASQLLYLEERLVLFARFQLAQSPQARSESRLVYSPGASELQVLLRDDAPLRLQVPDGFSLHTQSDLRFRKDVLAEGRVLAMLSASADDALAEPSVYLHLLPESQPQAPGDFRRALEFSLGHRRSAGLVEEPQFSGPIALEPPRTKLRLFGIRYAYRRAADGTAMDETLFLLTSPGGRQLLLGMRSARTHGLDFPPELLRILVSLEWGPAARASQ